MFIASCLILFDSDKTLIIAIKVLWKVFVVCWWLQVSFIDYCLPLGFGVTRSVGRLDWGDIGFNSLDFYHH